MIEKINIREKLARFTSRWDPKIVAELNGQHVKLVKPASTLNTGDAGGERTVAAPEWI